MLNLKENEQGGYTIHVDEKGLEQLIQAASISKEYWENNAKDAAAQKMKVLESVAAEQAGDYAKIQKTLQQED